MEDYFFNLAKKGNHFKKTMGNSYNLMVKAKNKRRKELLNRTNFDNIFDITIDNYKFNSFAYLLNSFTAISRLDYDGVMADLFRMLKNKSGDYFYKENRTVLEYLRTEDTNGLLDMHVLYSLHMTQKSITIDMLVQMIIKFGGLKEIICYLYDFYFIIMLEILDGNLVQFFYEFENDTLCNTEVAGVYMGILWLLTLVPELKGYGGIYIKKIDLTNNLHKSIPEKSIHARYMRGEITSTELYERCGSYSSTMSVMCPVVELEHLTLIMNGKYDGSEPDTILRQTLDDWADDVYSSDSLLRLNRNLIGMFIFNTKLCKELYDKQINIESLYEKSVEDKEKAENSARIVRVELKELQKKYENLEKEKIDTEKLVHSLQERTSTVLEKKVRDLEKQLKQAEQIEIEQTQKLLEQKKEISTQKKEIRKLNALLPEVEEEQTAEIIENVDEFSLDDAIEICKDKKILIVGGYGLSNMENKFSKYGINNVNMVVESRTLNGEYDVVVALTRVMRHMMGNLVDKYCDDTKVFIPYNGTNVETLIKRMAKELSDIVN